MNINQYLGTVEKLEGSVWELMGRLTQNERLIVWGKTKQLLGKLRERYHYSHAYAQERLREFIEEFSARGDPLAQQILDTVFTYRVNIERFCSSKSVK